MSSVTLQIRHDTAANWTTNNPTLAAGECGVETDTLKFKIGNGSTVWTSLAYQGSSASWPVGGTPAIITTLGALANASGVLTNNGSGTLSWGAGGGGTTTNSLTMNNGGAGAASGTTFNGGSAVTLSYNTIGAMPNVYTTVGQMEYCSATGTPGTVTALAGNTTNTPMYLQSTGTGSAATAPIWVSTLTVNGLTSSSSISSTTYIYCGIQGTGEEAGTYYYQSTSQTPIISASIIDSAGTIPAVANFWAHHHSTATPCTYVLSRSNSSTTTHGVVTNGMGIFNIIGVGTTQTGGSSVDYQPFGQISVLADSTGTISATSAPGQIQLLTTPNGSTTPTVALTINNAQNSTFAGTVSGTSFNSITGLATVAPLIDGTAAVGSSTLTARQDHVHPTDTTRQPLNTNLTSIAALANAAGALTNNGSGTFSYQTALTNPMTTLGDIMYGGASGAVTRLAGQTTNGFYVLGATTASSTAAAPAWASTTGTGNVILAQGGLTIPTSGSIVLSGAYAVQFTASAASTVVMPASTSATMNYYTSAPGGIGAMPYAGAASGLIAYLANPAAANRVLLSGNAAAPTWSGGTMTIAASGSLAIPAFAVSFANAFSVTGAYAVSFTAGAASTVALPQSASATMVYYTSAPAAANNIPYSTGTNGSLSWAAAANYGVVTTGATGVPQIIAGAAGLLVGSAAAIPAFSTGPTITGTFTANQINSTNGVFTTPTASGPVALNAHGAAACYLNYADGTNGVIFGNGASGSVGSVSAAGVATFNGGVTPNISSPSWASSMTLTTSGYNVIRITLSGSGATTLNFSAGLDGQKLLLELKQPSSGGPSTITWGTGVEFGTSFTSITLTATASKTDEIALVYNSSASTWRIIGYALGYT